LHQLHPTPWCGHLVLPSTFHPNWLCLPHHLAEVWCIRVFTTPPHLQHHHWDATQEPPLLPHHCWISAGTSKASFLQVLQMPPTVKPFALWGVS
jgi:hypothetical protein